MRYSDIKDACRVCRNVTVLTNANHTERPVGNGWMVRATRFLTYRGDNILYHLIDPNGISHGGYTSVQRFTQWAVQYIGNEA